MTDEQIVERARQASHTTTIDTCLLIHAELGKALISPLAVTRRNEHIPIEQWLLSKMPDLVDLAVFAWYALQERAVKVDRENPK